MKKRIISFLMALVMAVSLLPVSAFAAEDGVSPDVPAVEAQEVQTPKSSRVKIQMSPWRRQMVMQLGQATIILLLILTVAPASMTTWTRIFTRLVGDTQRSIVRHKLQ